MYITSLIIDENTVYDVEIANPSNRATPLSSKDAEKLKNTVENQLKPLIVEHHKQNPTKALVKIDASGLTDQNGHKQSHTRAKTEDLWRTFSSEIRGEHSNTFFKRSIKQIPSGDPIPLFQPTKDGRERNNSPSNTFEITQEETLHTVPPLSRADSHIQASSPQSESRLIEIASEEDVIEINTDQLERLQRNPESDREFDQLVSELRDDIENTGPNQGKRAPLPGLYQNVGLLLKEVPNAPEEEESYTVPNVTGPIREIAARKRKEQEAQINQLNKELDAYTKFLEFLNKSEYLESMPYNSITVKDLDTQTFTPEQITLIKNGILDSKIGQEKNLQSLTREKISELENQIRKIKQQGKNNMYQVGNFSNSSNLFYNCNRLQQLAQEGRDSNKGLNIKHLLRPFAFADRLATQFNATYIRGDNVKASATRKAAAFVVKALSFLVVAPILAGAYLFLEALNVTLRLVIFKGLCKGILYDKLMMPLYRAATGQPSEQAKILALNLQIGLILKSDLSDSDKNFAIKDLLSEDFPDQGKEIIKHFPELARQYDLEITPEAPLFVAQYVSGLFKSARFISAPIVNQSLNDGFNLEENLDNIQYLGRSNQINEQLPKLQLSSPSPTNDDSNSDIDPELDEDGFDRIVDTTKKRNIARQNSEFGTNFNHGPEISHENRTKIDAIMRTEISTPTSIDDRVSRSIDSTIDSDFEI